MTHLSTRAQKLSLAAKEGVFGVAARAEKAKAEGKPILDSTLGVAYNDAGKLFTLPTVENLLADPQLEKKSLAYAGIIGLPDFRNILPKLALKNELEQLQSARKIESFATHGGTGALTAAFYLFAENTVITGTPCWESYEKIATTQSLTLKTFPLLQKNSDGKFTFNIEGLRSTIAAENSTAPLSILLNHPCQNPTGYTPSTQEWQEITDTLKTASESHVITLVLDLAYHEYAANPEDRSFIRDIALQCPKLTVAIAMSNSKTYGMYGYRTGGLVVIHPETPIENLDNHARGFLRGMYSNMSRFPQEIITHIETNAEIKQKADNERENIRQILMQRGTKLIEAAQKNNLPVVTDADNNFSGGFFGFIPVETPEKSQKLSELLEADNTFFLALPEGLRIAICSMTEDSIEKGMVKIQEQLENMKF